MAEADFPLSCIIGYGAFPMRATTAAPPLVKRRDLARAGAIVSCEMGLRF
jgi:hypothetical protein